MTEQHPITPPLELVQEWCDEWYRLKVRVNAEFSEYVATQAARWGADQELEACEEWLPSDLTINGESLRDVRRPKPPSLARQAMEAQQRAWNGGSTHADWELIRAALERLQELEEEVDNGKV